MCGINAIYAWHPDAPPADGDELIRTRDAMRARGPDAAGAWLSPDHRLALGHRRLAILDPDARANQPMVIGDAVLVFNGEIYNFRELRAELRAQGDAAPFTTTSDTEVLLRMYLRFGAAMLPRLRGMFALAIWDSRRLFLARDPYGIKPLYYAEAGGTFRLASQVKALLAGGGVSATQDPAGIAGFLLRGSVPEPFTTYDAIRALPAGHSMEVTAAGASEPRPYFSLAEVWREASEEGPIASEEEGDVAEALRESVRLHLVSDVPVGAFLSAGRDSGSIVALAAESGAPLSTLTLRFDEYAGTEQNEAPLAEIVARRYGTRHTTVTLTHPEFERELPRVLAAMDQPSIDALNSWFVGRAAAQLGWKVALSGTGGDELFGGYGTFRSIPRFVQAFSVFRHLPGLARWYATAHRHLIPRGARFSPKSALAPAYCHSYEGAYLVKRGLFLPEELPALLGAEVAEEGLRRLTMLERFRTALIPDPGSAFARVATLEAAFYLRNQLLRDLDWCSMAHSLEVRLPLVDPFLLRRVARAALRGGKDLLARAPRQPLPAAVLKRRKTGFTIPAREWLDIPSSAGRAHPFGRRNWALFLYETAFLSKPRVRGATALDFLT
jgi:asparagine synthase (glutamine-hydrolysing)